MNISREHTNNYINEFREYCLQNGFSENNFLSLHNLDSYISTVVDAFSDYPVWTESFNGKVEKDTAAAMLKVDFKSRMHSIAGISGDNYESVMLFEPPMTKTTGILQYITSIDFKSFFLLFHPVTSRIDKFEKYAHKKRRPYTDDKTWYIYIFTTQKKYQRQGYGKRLIKTAVSFAKEKGYRICLETDLFENVAMYEAFGFSLMDSSIYNKSFGHYVMLYS